MPRPTDPSWIDGYRTALRDAERAIGLRAALCRHQAKKETNTWQSALCEETAKALEHCIGVFQFLAAAPPARDVSFDDEKTPRDQVGDGGPQEG